MKKHVYDYENREELLVVVGKAVRAAKECNGLVCVLEEPWWWSSIADCDVTQQLIYDSFEEFGFIGHAGQIKGVWSNSLGAGICPHACDPYYISTNSLHVLCNGFDACYPGQVIVYPGFTREAIDANALIVKEAKAQRKSDPNWGADGFNRHGRQRFYHAFRK